MTHIPRYVPAKTNQGWPVVGLIALLAAALIVSVTVIHRRTYKDPTDPTWHAIGGAGNVPKATGH
jgi:hypothetical protein